MPFARPTTTATPDEIFEEWVHVLRHAELLALLYVVRRTLGFKKVEDSISYTQFLDGITTREGKVLDRGCGIKNRTTLAAALRRLEELRLIHSYKTQDARGDRATTRYGLWFAGDDAGDDDHATGRAGDHPAGLPAHNAGGGSTQTVLPQYAPRTTGGTQSVPPVVRPTYPQQTVETTHTIQQTHLSKRAPRALPSSPSLVSTDSMVLTGNDVSLEKPVDPDASSLSAVVTRLSAEFGDDAPSASRTRVLNIRGVAGLNRAAMLTLLDEAAAITRSQTATITKRGRAGGVVRMPYLLATLHSLVNAPADGTGEVCLATPPVPDPPAVDRVDGMDDSPATTPAEAVWRAVRGELRRDLTAANYARWVAPTTAVDLDGDMLHVDTPDEAHRQWLRHKLHGCVERALGRTGYGEMRVAYDVASPAPLAAVEAGPLAAVEAGPLADVGDRISDPASPGAAPASPWAVPLGVPPLTSPGHTPAAVAVPSRAGLPLVIVPPAVVACPWCRAAPCHCLPSERLRRVVAARAPVSPPVGLSQALEWGAAP